MAGSFRKARLFALGYDPRQVDDFFEYARRIYEGEIQEELTGADIRGTSFDLVQHGYAPAAVDAALDRLEAAFTQKRRAAYVSRFGQDAWLSEASALAKTLYGRLVRPEGERFAPGHGSRPSYDRGDVDALCEDLIEYFDQGRPMAAKDIRKVRFGRRSGSRGYAEGPVDAFFDRAVEVMLLVE